MSSDASKDAPAVVAGAVGAAADGAPAAAPVTLDAVVAPLEAIPEAERAFGAASLVRFSQLMKKTQLLLLTRNPETEEIADQDRCALTALVAAAARRARCVQNRLPQARAARGCTV